MNYNRDYVKKSTLWDYEDLLKKLNAVLAYPVIRNAYNHSMPRAVDFARHLFSQSNFAVGEFPAAVITTFGRLRAVGVSNWADLLTRVATSGTCASFIEQNSLVFEEVIDVLNYLLRWAFPFHTATRELLNHEDPQEMEYYAIFKRHKLMCSFDLLERGCTQVERRSLAGQTSLPLHMPPAQNNRTLPPVLSQSLFVLRLRTGITQYFFLKFDLHGQSTDYAFQFSNPCIFLLHFLWLLKQMRGVQQKFLLPARQHRIFEAISATGFCQAFFASDQFKHRLRLELGTEASAFPGHSEPLSWLLILPLRVVSSFWAPLHLHPELC